MVDRQATIGLRGSLADPLPNLPALASCSAPSMTLRAGCAGAAARHHGPHLRAMPDLLSVGAREWSPRSNKRMTTVWLNQLLDCRLLAKRCDDRLNPGRFVQNK